METSAKVYFKYILNAILDVKNAPNAVWTLMVFTAGTHIFPWPSSAATCVVAAMSRHFHSTMYGIADSSETVVYGVANDNRHRSALRLLPMQNR